MKDWPKLVYAIIICELAGIIGSFFTMPSIKTWYAGLIKPSFNPPNWVFAPVWTALFLLMGISLYLVWIEKSNKAAITLFSLQLVINVIWSVLFFGMHLPFYSFVWVIILWLAILLTIIYFYRISKISAYLLIPYILWVSFAAVLNLFIFLLN